LEKDVQELKEVISDITEKYVFSKPNKKFEGPLGLFYYLLTKHRYHYLVILMEKEEKKI
jgi:hypothetical protein